MWISWCHYARWLMQMDWFDHIMDRIFWWGEIKHIIIFTNWKISYFLDFNLIFSCFCLHFIIYRNCPHFEMSRKKKICKLDLYGVLKNLVPKGCLHQENTMYLISTCSLWLYTNWLEFSLEFGLAAFVKWLWQFRRQFRLWQLSLSVDKFNLNLR